MAQLKADLNLGERIKGKAATLAKALELKGIKISQKGIVKKESGGRIGTLVNVNSARCG